MLSHSFSVAAEATRATLKVSDICLPVPVWFSLMACIARYLRRSTVEHSVDFTCRFFNTHRAGTPACSKQSAIKDEAEAVSLLKLDDPLTTNSEDSDCLLQVVRAGAVQNDSTFDIPAVIFLRQIKRLFRKISRGGEMVLTVANWMIEAICISRVILCVCWMAKELTSW